MVHNERGEVAAYATGRVLYSNDLCPTEAVQFIDRQNTLKPFFFSSQWTYRLQAADYAEEDWTLS